MTCLIKIPGGVSSNLGIYIGLLEFVQILEYLNCSEN